MQLDADQIKYLVELVTKDSSSEFTCDEIEFTDKFIIFHFNEDTSEAVNLDYIIKIKSQIVTLQ